MAIESRPGGWGDLPEGLTLVGLLEDLAEEPNEEDWQERALCAQADPEAWFPEKGGSTREAKRICLNCEVKDECLEYALDHDERFGVWGGLSERQRRRLKTRGILPMPTEAQVLKDRQNEQIRRLREQGLSVPEVALLVGVSTRTITRSAAMSHRERKVA